jgi:hypothetical protein
MSALSSGSYIVVLAAEKQSCVPVLWLCHQSLLYSLYMQAVTAVSVRLGCVSSLLHPSKMACHTTSSDVGHSAARCCHTHSSGCHACAMQGFLTFACGALVTVSPACLFLLAPAFLQCT